MKELLPVIFGAAVRGREWAGQTIRACCDNMTAVHILQWCQSKDPQAMHPVRCLCLIECSFNFTLVSHHLPGRYDDLADTFPETTAFTLLPTTHRPMQNPPQFPVCSTRSWFGRRLHSLSNNLVYKGKTVYPLHSFPPFYKGIACSRDSVYHRNVVIPSYYGKKSCASDTIFPLIIIREKLCPLHYFPLQYTI